jgi:hypothetical protein
MLLSSWAIFSLQAGQISIFPGFFLKLEIALSIRFLLDNTNTLFILFLVGVTGFVEK